MNTTIKIEKIRCIDCSDFAQGFNDKDEFYAVVAGIQSNLPVVVAKRLPSADNYLPLGKGDSMTGLGLRDNNNALVSPLLYESTFPDPAKKSALLFISFHDQELTGPEPLGGFNLQFDGANAGWKILLNSNFTVKETRPDPRTQVWEITMFRFQGPCNIPEPGHCWTQSGYEITVSARTL